MSGYKRVNYYELCRLCTSSEGSKIHIFCEDGKRRQLQNKIQICLPLHVCEDDSLPKIVCLGCLEKLESFYDFRESCVTSKSMLESYFTSMRFSDDLLKEGKVYIKEPSEKRKLKSEPNPVQSPTIQNSKPSLETINTFQPVQIISTERHQQQNNENQTNVPQLMLSWANPQSTDVLQLQIKDGSLQDRIKIFENLPTLLAQNMCLKCKQIFVNQEDVTNHICVTGESSYIIPDPEIPEKSNKPTITSIQSFEAPQKSPKTKKEQNSSINASTSLRTSAALAANRTLTQNAISSLLTSNTVCPSTSNSDNVQQNIPNPQSININLNGGNINQQNYNLNFNQTNLTNSLIENHFNQSLAAFNTSQPQDNMNLIGQNNIITTSSGQFSTVGNLNQTNLNNLNMLNQNANINQTNNLISGQNCGPSNPNNVQTSTHNNLSLGQTYVLNQNQNNQTHVPTSQVSNITETVLSQLSNVPQNNYSQNSSQQNLNKSDESANSSEPPNQSKMNQQQNQSSVENSNQNQTTSNQSTSGQNTGLPGSFTCETCNKCFKRKEHLLQHRKLHSGERPFTCLSCLKSFSRKEHLLRHSISHTGTKNFQCDLCQKSFSRKDNLHKHRKTHEVSGPYICDVCNKSFVIKHYYLIHKMSHQSDDKDTVTKTTKKGQKTVLKNESTINMSDLKAEPETYIASTVNNTAVNSSSGVKPEEPMFITSMANSSVPFSVVKTTVHNSSLVQTVTRNANGNSDITNHLGNIRTPTIDQTSSEQPKSTIHFTNPQSQQNDKQNISNMTQNSLIPNTQNFQQITQQNAVVSLGQAINNSSSSSGNINNMQNTIIQNFVPISGTNFTELAYAAHNTRNIVQHVSVANNIHLIEHNKHLAQILTNPKYREKYAGGLKIESVICKEPMLNQGIIVVPKNEQIIMSERTDSVNKIDSSNKLKKLKTNHTKSLTSVNDLNNKTTNVLFSGTIKSNGGNNVSPLLASNIMTSIQQNNIFSSDNVSTHNTMPTISTSNAGQFICSNNSANELQQFDYNKRINS